MRAEGRSTKCSFSFKCIHAIRQTPYLPEVLQKGRGRPGRWAGWREGERRWWRGGGTGVWMGGERDFMGELNGGETEKVEDFGDVDSRTMFIHEEGKREKWSNYSSFMSGTVWPTKAQQNNPGSRVHVENKLPSAEDTSSSSSQHKCKLIVKQSHHYFWTMNSRTGKCIQESDQSKQEVMEFARQGAVTLR